MPELSKTAGITGRDGSARRPAAPLARVIWAFAICYAIASFLVAAYRYAGERGGPVLWPFLATILTFTCFVLVLLQRQPHPHLLEIGVIFAGMLTMYAAYPLLSYALSGFVVSEQGESRLFAENAEPRHFATIGWWYWIFLVSFCVAYLLGRGRRSRRTIAVSRPADGAVILTLVVAYVATKAVVIAFGWAYDLNATSYLDAYAQLARVPLFARQLLLQVSGYDLTLQLCLLTALFSRYRRMRWWIAGFLFLTLALQFMRPGARTQLFLLFVATIQLYDYVVGRIRLHHVAIAATVGFAMFSVLAVLRQPVGPEVTRPTMKAVLLAPNEFDVISANAIDLKFDKVASGVFLQEPGLYWAEFFAFVPQQLLPWRKNSASLWYTGRYYPELQEAGGSFAFGAVSEAVVGLGAVELVWRGALIGLAFGMIHAWVVRRAVPLVGLIFYVWLSVWSFQAIRNTTFCLITLFVYRFLAPVIAVSLVAWLVRRSVGGTHRGRRQSEIQGGTL